jgi:hypothetical protein
LQTKIPPPSRIVHLSEGLRKGFFRYPEIPPLPATIRSACIVIACGPVAPADPAVVTGSTLLNGKTAASARINMTLSMAFVAPAIVKAAIKGRLPRGIGIAAEVRRVIRRSIDAAAA